jgi:hypothetical protein
VGVLLGRSWAILGSVKKRHSCACILLSISNRQSFRTLTSWAREEKIWHYLLDQALIHSSPCRKRVMDLTGSRAGTLRLLPASPVVIQLIGILSERGREGHREAANLRPSICRTVGNSLTVLSSYLKCKMHPTSAQ